MIVMRSPGKRVKITPARPCNPILLQGFSGHRKSALTEAAKSGKNADLATGTRFDVSH
jgi:hypothetical protein